MELPKFQPAPICRENWIAVVPPEVDEEELLELDELLLEELELEELVLLEDVELVELLLDEEPDEEEPPLELLLIDPVEAVRVTRSNLAPSSRLEIRSV